MAGPFTYPVAFSTPFENEPDRSNGFTSDNVQEAIEEALDQAIANDRFLLLSYYNGNANPNRLLEFYPGIDSDEAPIIFNSASQVLSIVARTVAVNSNAVIGFYDKITDPTYSTPLYTVDMNNQKVQIITGTPLFLISAGTRLVIKVISGSIQKPHLQLTFSSTI